MKTLTLIFAIIIFPFFGFTQSTDNFPGTALDFDGTDDYVNIPHTSIGNPAGDFTIEVWAKLNSTPGGNASIISKHKNDGGSARSGYAIEYNPGSGVYGIIGTSSGWKTVSGGLWNTNEWHHVVLRYNATTDVMEFFDNGESQGTQTVTNPAYNSQDLRFAASHYYGNYCNCTIDEVRYWTTARTTEQVRENMYLPLSGSETGLVSYWQLNDGSGTTASDNVSGYDGTLTNMADEDWINSDIPFGPGFADTQTETNGTLNFTNTGLSMDFSSQNGAEITATRIDDSGNINPTGPETVFDSQYWIVNRFGTGSFNTDLTFTVSEDLTTEDQSFPSNVKLYTRGSNADNAWSYLAGASSVNAANNTVTFTGITSFSQFIVTRDKDPLITILKNFDFDLVSQNFSSIDIGGNVPTPAFTDLDGDGLLDLIVGEYDGTLNHYEQNSENSTSFTLVTSNFNSIDVGSSASPTFTDLDSDGLLDMLVGDWNGKLNHYEQDSKNSTSFSLVTGSFNSIQLGAEIYPTFTDLDGDGLLDLIVGEYDGNLNHYEQDSENSTSFTLVTSNFNSIDVGEYATPAFGDIDGDGLLDLLVGEMDGNLYHYEQDSENSTSFTQITSFFSSVDVGTVSTPAFIDIDGDGVLDMIVGESNGTLYHYEQPELSNLSFGNQLTGQNHVIKYYVKASGLLNDLEINSPSDFLVSLTEGAGYSQSLSLSPVNNLVSDTLFVKFAPAQEISYSGDINHTSDAAQTKSLAVSGTGTSYATDNTPITALDFDGSNDYVGLGNSGTLKPESQLTVEAWIYHDNYNSYTGMVISNAQNGGYMLGAYSSTSYLRGQVYVNGSNLTVFEYLPNFSAGWHHLALTYDGRYAKLYVDGELKSTSDAGANYPITYNATNHTLLGAEAGTGATPTGDYCNGRIEEVRVWNTARTQAQIRENMHLPLTSGESGLVSCWQFNEGSGTTVSDAISGNNGTLTNMTDDDWVSSTIPYGPGYADIETEANGRLDFHNTGLSMNFYSQNGAELTVTRIDTSSNINPENPETVFDSQYWVVNRYGTGSFNSSITFTISEDLTANDQSFLSNIKLYTRGSNDDGGWTYLAGASSVDVANNTATFKDITSFSQFIIARDKYPQITLLNPFELDLESQEFNSIDAGDRSSPVITDFDGDGVLDLIVGEENGNLVHYKQDSENSTSFTLVTSNFNSIDVGREAAPVFTDIDSDGLLDLIVGEYDGNLNHYEQAGKNSTSFTFVTSNFNSIDVGFRSKPAFADIDGDGLLDLIVGEHDGNLNHYEQDSENSTSFTLVTESFNSIDVGNESAPVITDLDGDGILDLIVGENDGYLNYYEQNSENSTSFKHITSNFSSVDEGKSYCPTFADLDGDFLLDMIVGEVNGTLYHYEQPVITSLSFGGTETGKSSYKKYYIKASGLHNDLDINSPSGFTVSLSENSGYAQSLTLSQVDGIVSRKVYVKFSPVQETAYSGDIDNSSDPAQAQSIFVSGTGIKMNTALDFDGTDDYVNIPHTSIGNPAGDFTIEVWAKLNSTPGGYASIISKHKNDGGSARSGYAIEYNPGSGVYGIIGTSSGWKTVSGGLWNTNEWHHVVLRYNATTDVMEFFDNGESQGTQTVTNPAYTSQDLRFAASHYYGNYCNCTIDEVRYWTTALTTEQVRENMYLPLSGSETGLVSYWQLNDGSGTTASDNVSGYDGTLTNMADEDWINSDIPFGPGFADSQTETTGTLNFTSTGLSMDFSSQNGAEITVTRIDTSANINPDEPKTMFDSQYWVVNRYGTGSFNTDLTFTISEALTADDESYPANIKLYTRGSNAHTDWIYLAGASSVDASNNTATFSGISSFSQFIVAREHSPQIILLDPFKFDLVTKKFNSIDVSCDAAPVFTDLDGDGLLDFLLGKCNSGAIAYYVQDSKNSTSFTRISSSFNNIGSLEYIDPAITDIDGDGLLDLIIGQYDNGSLYHYEQDSKYSTSFSFRTSNFNNISLGDPWARPTFTDIDGDGLLDLVVGAKNHQLCRYEQDSENSTSFTLVTSNFSSIYPDNATPFFTDFNGDGLLDLIFSEWNGGLHHYVQDSVNSTSFTHVTSNFNSLDNDIRYNPTVKDIDGDGLLDLLVGENGGDVLHYKQREVNNLIFGNTLIGVGAIQHYYIKADGLIDDLTIDCPSGFTASLSENSGYSQSITLSPVNNIFSDTIFVKFSPTQETDYSGNIVHTSGAAQSKSIAVSGYGGRIENYRGTALDFDGADDYVDCSDNPEFNIPNNLTVEAWIMADSWQTNVWGGSIVSKVGSGFEGYALRCGDNGKLNMVLGISGSWVEATSSSLMSTGTWYHVAGVYDGSNITLYINGEQAGQTSASGNITTSPYNLFIGESTAYPGRLFDGKIDEACIWNVALAEQELRNYSHRTLYGNEPGLISYWQMNEGSGSTTEDRITRNTGTLTNMSGANWVSSTAPVPFESNADGNWADNSKWLSGQGYPTNIWARATVNSNLTLAQNMEVIDLEVENGKSLTINPGYGLTVSDSVKNQAGPSGIVLESDATHQATFIQPIAEVDATVERYLTQSDYHYISAPVMDQNISNEFVPVPIPATVDFYKFDEPANLWDNIKDGSGNLDNQFETQFVVGRGYAYANSNAVFTKNFTGELNYDDLTITLDKQGSSANNGWNLVGNIYPANLAANTAADASNNFLSNNATALDDNHEAVYFYDGNDYVAVNQASAESYIAPTQGFFVKAATDGAELAFNAADQKHASATFYKNGSAVSRFTLGITGPQGDENEILLAFIPGTSKGLDPGYDAQKLKGNSNLALFSLLVDDDGNDYAIQSLPQVDNQTVKLGLDAGQPGLYEFGNIQMENLNFSTIFLEDKTENLWVNLNLNTSYQFTISQAGSYEDRFVLHFGGIVTGIEETSETEIQLSILCDGESIILQNLSDELLEGIYTFYNLAGQELDTRNILVEGHSSLIQSPKLVAGMYFVAIHTNKGVFTHKVVFSR